MLNLYVTGCDKIFVTAGLAATMQSLGYSSAVYKPVVTGGVKKNGFIESKDLLFVKFVDPFIKTYSSYIFEKPYTPILSAAYDRISIEKNKILGDFQSIQKTNECIITDGCCGLNTPLGKNFIEKNIADMLDLPILFTINAKTPDINKILLEINSANNINQRGAILTNYIESSENPDIKFLPAIIEEYTGVKVLGALPEFPKELNPNDLITEIINRIDIEAVFNIEIAKLKN